MRVRFVEEREFFITLVPQTLAHSEYIFFPISNFKSIPKSVCNKAKTIIYYEN
jgi:hypothetical protein